MKRSIILIITVLILILSSCNTGKKKSDSTEPSVSPGELVADTGFNKTINGNQYQLYTLKNNNGVTLKLTNDGASIVQILVPDKEGNFDDVVLGYRTIEGYINDNMYQGCIVGRYANRIHEGKFELDGKVYDLSINNMGNTLHGGPGGLHTKFWKGEKEGNSVEFTYTSPHMEEGYPGELSISVVYTLTDDNEMIIDYTAKTDRPTFVNLSNHMYVNLLGEAKGDILDHELQIFADYITPVDSTLIPTGEIREVKGTPFDFREPHKIGESINADNTQLKYGKGYDHNWVLAMEDREEPRPAVKLYEPQTGRMLEIATSEPGIQFYSGNFMDGTVEGKNGNMYDFRHALALEPQHFPDSPNHDNFPTTLLLPEETYKQITVYTFSVKEE